MRLNKPQAAVNVLTNCTATGVDLDHEESLNKKFRDAANNIAGITSDRALKFWLHNDFTWNRSNDKIKMDKDLNFLNGILNMIIKKRMENDNNPDVKNTSGESLKTFSDILFHLKDTDGEKVFTDQDVKDHVTTLIVAGYDTVALSLLYTILLIGSYPKVQNKIYAELADVFGKSDRDVTKIDLSRLVYLDAALKESIRLYPVAPYIARLLDRDIKLKNLTLYSGNSCYMSIYGINRHPIWGSDADQFKPERWLDPARLPKNRNYFASFSFGRRNCIGKSYATMWMKIVLVYILRRYVITGDHTKTVSMYEVLLKPVSGHLVTVEKRKALAEMITDPDDCLAVANNCLAKDHMYSFVKPLAGDGLVTASPSVWKRDRKYLNPAFKQQILDQFMPLFNSQARRLVTDLEKSVGSEPFGHDVYLLRNMLETIYVTTTGLQLRQDNPDDAEFSETIIENRKIERRNGTSLAPNSNGIRKTLKSFLDLLLDMKDRGELASDQAVREHMNTIIIAGYDTNATVLTYALVLIGSIPHVQERLYNELQEIFGTKDRDVEKQDLSKLVYAEAVLKETMRLYPIVPVLARCTEKELQLKNCTLYPGTTCVLMAFASHRLSIWGEDAHEFKPDRWLNPEKLPKNCNAFFPFSLGRRNCIGKAYAMMSMKITLVHWLRQYRISGDHTKMVLKLDCLLKPVSGHYITIQHRK
ncbi:cytochrome P450 4V2-like [Battus philenor]|uniref:cytochrome P450 4V2-like n=1 Tax=Battus philenor TaxID=42288 RepID=UPI0035D07C5A